jgi:hypothetical protein
MSQMAIFSHDDAASSTTGLPPAAERLGRRPRGPEIHKDVRRAPSDDDNPSAALTLWTAVGGAAANLEDLQD